MTLLNLRAAALLFYVMDLFRILFFLPPQIAALLGSGSDDENSNDDSEDSDHSNSERSAAFYSDNSECKKLLASLFNLSYFHLAS